MKIVYIDYNDITKHVYVVLQDVMEQAVNKLKNPEQNFV